MRRKEPPFVAGNWKMHLTLSESAALINALIARTPVLGPARWVVLPPFTILAPAAYLLRGKEIGLGGQDLYWEDQGAFTGEVSAAQLADAGCRYVVIGHSERRQLFGETDASVNRKIGAALRAGLVPIVCIGETLAEREAGRMTEVVGGQLEGGLAGLADEAVGGLVLAYEPVWAIGTGRTATPAQAEEMHAFIRRRLEEKYGKTTAFRVNILYGGSVKPANAYSLFKEQNIDGFLVGGASLEAEPFLRIGEEAVKAYKEVQ